MSVLSTKGCLVFALNIYSVALYMEKKLYTKPSLYKIPFTNRGKYALFRNNERLKGLLSTNVNILKNEKIIFHKAI